jgi:hypothetical protein
MLCKLTCTSGVFGEAPCNITASAVSASSSVTASRNAAVNVENAAPVLFVEKEKQ